jgi:hypothetical protein
MPRWLRLPAYWVTFASAIILRGVAIAWFAWGCFTQPELGTSPVAVIFDEDVTLGDVVWLWAFALARFVALLVACGLLWAVGGGVWKLALRIAAPPHPRVEA